MSKALSLTCSLTVLGTLALLCATPLRAPAQEEKAAPPNALETQKQFPNACVDCHIARPEGDTRLSVLMKAYTEQAPARLMDRIKKVAPEGVELKGKHPAASSTNVPKGCFGCHGPASKTAPAFGKMIHAIHLTGTDNHYLHLFGGVCVHCHKIDTGTGAVEIPSAAEKS